MPDGFGKATFPSGDIFEGTYSNGRRHGKGKYTFANGAYYEGDYADNVKEGQGTMEYPDKGKYEGEDFSLRKRPAFNVRFCLLLSCWRSTLTSRRGLCWCKEKQSEWREEL